MRPDLAIGSGAPHEAATWESNVAATHPSPVILSFHPQILEFSFGWPKHTMRESRERRQAA
jgi:hypothetical protein